MGEKILAVKSPIISGLNYPQGAFPVDYTTMQRTIKYLDEFVEVVDRNSVERNPNYRQLIPYIVLISHKTYFSAVRTDEGGDSRLHGKRIVGFGGHMNPVDMPGPINLMNQIMINAQRELDEELILKEGVNLELAGFINDFSTPVSQDHFGIYIKGELTDPLVYINESSVLMDAKFMTKDELLVEQNLENWSKLVLSVF